MWGGSGNAVGEQPAPATNLMSVVSTCVRKTCMGKKARLTFDQTRSTCDCHVWNRPGFGVVDVMHVFNATVLGQAYLLAFLRFNIDDSSIAYRQSQQPVTSNV